MNEYQHQQLDALDQVRSVIDSVSALWNGNLCDEIQSYLKYRRRLDGFLSRNFSRLCTRTCFESRRSACCSKDGIVTFWADVVLNVYRSNQSERIDLSAAIKRPLYPGKCIYLGKNGCLWKIRPLGCALFLCDQAQADVFSEHPDLGKEWEGFRQRAKRFRWPDRVVLFDQLEQVFLSAGCRSELMYINTSPGLRRIKKNAGLL